MSQSFYTKHELNQLGFTFVGEGVQVSRKVSLYKIKGSIGDNVRIDDYSVLIGFFEIKSFIHIAPFCIFNSGNAKITINNYVSISSHSSFFASSDNHSGSSLCNPTVLKKYRNSAIEEDIDIGEASCIGSHSVILPGVIVPKYTAIGAGSVLTKQAELKSGSIYASRAVGLVLVGQRDPEKIKATIKEHGNSLISTT